MIFLLLMLAAALSTDRLQERLLLGRLARHDLVEFARLTSPLPSEPLNARLSRYMAKLYHYAIAEKLRAVQRGQINRLLISLPPRHGKTELAVRKFVPFVMGNAPDKGVITITHSDSLAWEHGRDVRNCFLSPGYRTVFTHSDCYLREDSQARDRLQLKGGGVAMFTGRGGLGGGFGAGGLIFDDFFKNADEARSEVIRDHAWECYVSDCKSRLNESTGWIVIIGTRKHEDDVIGRILDPYNPHYDPTEAARWTVVRLPALAESGDPLGRAVDEPLWPERFPFPFWQEKRTHRSELVRVDFQTQDQCNPCPAEGNYFKRKWLMAYEPHELPKLLRVYAASDHAFRVKQKNDLSCLMVAGVDASGTVWVLPDTWWKRAETDELVEAMLALMQNRMPLEWFAAKDAISGSIGPFLRKRMRETSTFCNINEVTEDVDLVRRAQSIRNRCAMGMVRFPARAPWWSDAENELLKFPNGRNDDFVAALALFGMGLDRMIPAQREFKPQDYLARPMTMAWVKQSDKVERARRKAAKELEGW